MNISDEKIQDRWAKIDSDNLNKALSYLRNTETEASEYIAECVASLCDVNVEDMLSNTNVIFLVHARWLYWYAYRYMTNESFDKMSHRLKTDSKTFGARSIQKAVTKMSMLIASEPIWSKRWAVVKRIIKLRNNSDKKTDNTIVVQVPKELKDKVNIVIKTK